MEKARTRKKIPYEVYRDELFSLLEGNNYTFTRKQAFEVLGFKEECFNHQRRFHSALVHFRKKIDKSDYFNTEEVVLRVDYLIADRIPLVYYISELKCYLFPYTEENFKYIIDQILRNDTKRKKGFLLGIKRLIIFHTFYTIEQLEDFLFEKLGGEQLSSFLEICKDTDLEDIINLRFKELKDKLRFINYWNS